MFYFDIFSILINNECANMSSAFWCKMCCFTEKYVKSSYKNICFLKHIIYLHWRKKLFIKLKCLENSVLNTFPLPKFASNYVTGCLQQNSNELNDKSSLWKQYEISNSVKSLKSLIIRKVSNNFISIKR